MKFFTFLGSRKHQPMFILPHLEDWTAILNWHHWTYLGISPVLEAAIEHKDKQALAAAFNSCDYYYRRGYEALRHGKIEEAAREYLAAGCDNTAHIFSLNQWRMSFRDNLARNLCPLGGRGIIELPLPLFDIWDLLPNESLCVGCGVVTIKPSDSFAFLPMRCPKCGHVQDYGEQDRNRIIASATQAAHGDLVRQEELNYQDILIRYRSRDKSSFDDFAPQFHLLISLLRPEFQ